MSLYQLLESINDVKLLKAVYTLLSREKQQVDFWDTLSKEEKKDVEEGIHDIEDGRVFSHAGVMKELKTRYNL